MSELSDLPLSIKEVKKNIPSVSKQKAKAPLIACIDDSLQVCQTVGSIITSNGMKFVQIQDAIQAIPLLIENKPDLIFLDLMMPVVNGYEVCAQIRRVSKLANIPIIILTGSDGLFDKFRAKVAGSTDFMTKPIVAEKLLAAINKHLEKPIPNLEQQVSSNKASEPQFAM